jgi:phosphoadenosine phosphosulfate reductase
VRGKLTLSLTPVIPAQLDLESLNAQFEDEPAQAIVAWAVETFGDRLAVASSFQDAVLIDLAVQADPDVEVVFVDTGEHFPETLRTVERVRQRYDLNLHVAKVEKPPVRFPLLDPINCCSFAKVAALEEALDGKVAWMSGLRRSDSPTRADAPIVSWDQRGLVKINPLANWSDADVASYMLERDVIYNPLLDRGYLSIGCAPCTRPVQPGEHPRAGRWAGTGRTECGLHI